MAGIYRRVDAQETLAIRGLCLLISMSPILCAVPAEAFAQWPRFFGWILLAALAASLGAWPGFLSFRFLPVGIANSFMTAFNSMMVCIYGFLIFHEQLSKLQILIIGTILVCVFFLGMLRSATRCDQPLNPRKGLLLCCLFGIGISTAYIILSHVSRNLHPILAAYSWEAGIGLISFLIMLIRKISRHKPIFSITWPDIGRTFLFSWPTLLGTAGYMLAVTMGPISIIAAISSTTIVVTTLLARYFYKETLHVQQWAFLAAICVLIGALRLVAPS